MGLVKNDMILVIKATRTMKKPGKSNESEGRPTLQSQQKWYLHIEHCMWLQLRSFIITTLHLGHRLVAEARKSIVAVSECTVGRMRLKEDRNGEEEKGEQYE